MSLGTNRGACRLALRGATLSALLMGSVVLAGCNRDLGLAPYHGSTDSGGTTSSTATGSGGGSSGGLAGSGGVGGSSNHGGSAGDTGGTSGDTGGLAGEAGAAGDSSDSGTSLIAEAVDPIEMMEDADPITITLDGFDEDGANAGLEVTVDQLPELASLSPASGSAPLQVTYSPHPNAFGNDTFRFFVEDAEEQRSVPREVRIEISAVNDAPSAQADNANTDSQTSVEIAVLENDTDVDDDAADLRVVSVTQPEHGDVVINQGGTVTYVPTHPWEGTATFTYTVADPHGAESAAEISVEVSRGFDHPDDWDDDGIANEDEASLGTDPLDADSDDDGVPDGIEDENHNGSVDVGETDPSEPDTDDDGVCDGFRVDNDGDGIDPVDDCVGPVFVDASNTSSLEDGETWATAFTTVQPALELADGIRPVWVAKGHYVADSPRASVASAPEGSRLYGGFAGDETYLSARDADSRDTIFDGDFSENDVEDVTLNRTDNSEQVVEFLGAGRLDGFLVQNGQKVVDSSRVGAGIGIKSGGVVLENVDFIRNVSSFNGGAVGCRQGCELEVRNALFEQNDAVQGGAIYATADVSGKLLALDNVEFVANHATSMGGAVYTHSTIDVLATTVTFQGNRSDDDGGAFYANGGTTTLESSDFIDNQAVDSGGGMFNVGVLYATAVAFQGNTANYGGALRSWANLGLGDVHLTNVDLIENSATAEGGGIYNRDALTEIRSCEIRENHATSFGGGILQWSGTVDVEDSLLINNIADRMGGAIRCYQGTTKATATSFQNNVANERGAGLEQFYGTADLNAVEFKNNSSPGDTAVGGGLYCVSAVCDAANSAFSANQAYKGAGMYCSSSECTLQGLEFDSNPAVYSGGGLYCYASTCEVDTALFTKNSGQYAAGTTCVTGSTCSFSETKFASNTVSSSGGSVYCQTSDCQFDGGLFVDNRALFAGGLMCWDSTCDLSSTVFLGNRATTSGGAIYQNAGTVDLERVVFLRNQGTYGGGIFEIAAADLLARNVAFIGNTGTSGRGGAIHTDSSAAHFQDLTFLGNSNELGGAAHHRTQSDVTYTGVTLALNTAIGDGGALHIDNDSSPVLTNVALIGNEAARGGAMYSKIDSYPTLTNVSLYGNIARDAGAAVYNEEQASTTLLNSILFANLVASTPSDLVDVSTTQSRAEHVFSQQPLTGVSNGTLAVDPFEHDRPQALFLDQALSGVTPIDAGSDALADDPDFGFGAVGSADWSALTTSLDGATDDGTVDAGRHYSPDAVVIKTFEVDSANLEYETDNADECVWFTSSDNQFVHLEGDAVASGTAPHGHGLGTEIVFVCFGAAGEPAVATGTVP